MTADRTSPAAPAVPGPIKRWVLGARPRTLPAAVVPVLVGTAAAHSLNHHVGYRGEAVLSLRATSPLVDIAGEHLLFI